MEPELLVNEQGPDFWEALLRGLTPDKKTDPLVWWVLPLIAAFLICASFL
jgi:hypothetical protein